MKKPKIIVVRTEVLYGSIVSFLIFEFESGELNCSSLVLYSY